MGAGASAAELDERYHAILLQAPTPICITRGPHHRVEIANPAYRALFPSPDAIGKPFRDAYRDCDLDYYVQAMDRVFRSGERFVVTEARVGSRDPGADGAPGDAGARTEERFFNLVYDPLHNDDGAVDGIMILALEVTAQVQARRALEAAQQRSSFLAQASAALSESLDYKKTLRRVAELSVPDIADWCTVTAVDEDGVLRRVAVVHRDPAKADLVAEYERHFPPGDHRVHTVADVAREGRAVMSERVVDEDLVRIAQTPDHLRVMRGLGCASAIIVPMVARGESLGVICLMRADPYRPFNAHDSATALELAHRAALAVDNARLYRQARRREKTMRFFAEASVLLSSSLDPDSICQRLARLVVPHFADWCGVDLEHDGGMRTVAIAHSDPGKVEAAWELRRRYPPQPGGMSFRVLRTGRSEVHEINDDVLRATAGDEQHLRFRRELGLRSVMLVPIVASGRAFGVLNLVWGESGRSYGREDQEVMEELARRAGLAIENARLYDEAREAIHLRDEFLSIASHELKTPLTSLRLQVGGIWRAAGRGLPVDPKLAQRLDMIDKQVGRLGELVEGLLDVSRAAVGQLELDWEDVDLAEVVRAVGERFKPDLAAVGSVLTVEVTGDPVAEDLPAGRAPGADLARTPQSTIFGRWDRPRLIEIVTNFVANAMKYGAGKPIRLRARATPATAVIEVEDEGIGIAPADVQRLFKRFARMGSPEHYGGFGLGLWIVKVLVDAMGGTVEVESAVGQGSLFRAVLPRRPAEEPSKDAN
jgi:signal transduction histidine kinase